jgi:hypothetical protein
MMRTAVHILLLLACKFAAADGGIYKDQFLSSSVPGDLAIAPEMVSRLANTKFVLPLERNGTQVVTRRPTCILAIAHRDPDQSKLVTFVGIQLIKVFRNHATPGVIYVVRNGSWYSRDERKLLADEKGEVAVKSMTDFATAHLSTAAFESLSYADGKKKVATSWHARLGSAKDSDYSGDDPYVRFWQIDPTTEQAFHKAYPDLLVGDPPIRIENRLVSFTITDGNDPLHMPSIGFDCKDPSLDMVAIRTYLPFASDVAWTYLKFQ